MSHTQPADTAHNLHLRTTGEKTWVLKLDPRLRVVSAIVFACVTVALQSYVALGTALGLALVMNQASRLPLGSTLRKVIAMDSFIIVMLFMLPFTTPGETWFTIMGFDASYNGLHKALEIMLKANAIVLMLLTLVGTIEATVLGHALNRLKVPVNLVHLLLFTVRYIDVLKQEYFRLRLAMKARCFKARNSLHTYRSIGYLVGMLMIRSLERSERILEAMKCRGFQGKFYLLDEFHFQTRDRIATICFSFAVIALPLVDFYYG